MTYIRKAAVKTVKAAAVSAVLFFVISFTIYIFNLDMKLTAAAEPYLEKWHDRGKRERKL